MGMTTALLARMGLMKILELCLVKVDLNDPKLILKSHIVGALLGGASLWAAGFGEFENASGDTMGFMAGALFLTLLLPYRLHCQTTEGVALKIMGTFPSVILGAGWPLVIFGGVHPIWWLLWPLANLLFAVFWYMGGMSRGYQLGLNAQLYPLPPCIAMVVEMLMTPVAMKHLTGATPNTFAVLGDQIIRAYSHADEASLQQLLAEAEEWIKTARKAAGMSAEKIDLLFAQARREAETTIERAIQMSLEQLGGDGANLATKVRHPSVLGHHGK